MLKSIDNKADAWSEGSRVFLREPTHGASSILWVDLYGGPEITDDNFDSDEVSLAYRLAKLASGILATKWRNLSWEEARDEYDSL